MEGILTYKFPGLKRVTWVEEKVIFIYLVKKRFNL